MKSLQTKQTLFLMTLLIGSITMHKASAMDNGSVSTEETNIDNIVALMTEYFQTSCTNDCSTCSGCGKKMVVEKKEEKQPTKKHNRRAQIKLNDIEESK